MTHGYFQTVAGADDSSADDATELKWELDEDLFVVLFRFLLISSGAQLGRSGSPVGTIGDLAFGVILFSFGS